MSGFNNLYILDDNGEPIPESDVYKWGTWYGQHKLRVVAQEHIQGSKVSTVFLGLDHQYGDGPPILWETMIFGGPLDQQTWRCSGSREQAEAMHNEAIRKLMGELARNDNTDRQNPET